MIRIGVLTTDTTHHRHFVYELNRSFVVSAVVVEKKCLKAPFATNVDFETTRDTYELSHWGDSGRTKFIQYTQSLEVNDINDSLAVEFLAKLAPDLIIDFGTSRVRSQIFEIPKIGTWNLHGGDPEEFRGLDSHLWAIYHADFRALVSTLHVLEEGLDTGKIILKSPIPIASGMPVFQLRARNTETCIEITLRAIRELSERGTIAMKEQIKKGRYYSFMPAPLKEICAKKFQLYTVGLP